MKLGISSFKHNIPKLEMLLHSTSWVEEEAAKGWAGRRDAPVWPEVLQEVGIKHLLHAEGGIGT